MGAPPSGGGETVYGWVVVAGSHVVFMFWVGLLKTIGVLLPSLTERYGTNAWVIGWIVAGVCAANNIAAVFGSVLRSVIGGRQVAILGGVMATSGLLLAAVSSKLLPFALSLISLTGVGTGVIMCMCKVYLGIYFEDRLALASGIATMGVPVGLIIFPTLAEFLSRLYGVQGTLLIYGALEANLVICGLLLRRPRGRGTVQQHRGNGYAPLGQSSATEVEEEGEEDGGCRPGGGCQPGALRVLRSQVVELLDIRLLTRADLWLLILVYTFFSFVNDSWMTFLVSNARTKGFGGFVATSFSVIAGWTAVVFSLLQGMVISYRLADIRAVSAMAAVLGAAALFANPFLGSYPAMGAAVAAYGVSLAVLNPTVFCLAIETYGRERAASALGWMGLSSGLFRITFGFLPGLLYDITRRYDATFVLFGILAALIVPALYLDRLTSTCVSVTRKQ